MNDRRALDLPDHLRRRPPATRRQSVVSALQLCVTLAVLAAALPWMATGSARSAPEIDPVRSWNEQALATARRVPLSDARAARLYAMVNVAMYDAVNGILWHRGNDDRRHEAIVDPVDAPPDGDEYAAAVGAAHAVLSGEHPALAADYDTQRDADLARLQPNQRTDSGFAWGRHVGGEVRAARQNDGSSPNEPGPIGSGVGHFRDRWSGAQFRKLAPFAIDDPSEYVGDGPAALESENYRKAFDIVKDLGDGRKQDQQKLDTFQYWSLGNGTSQPPGAWIQVALRVTESRPQELADAARLFALVGIAMADTVGPTVATKYKYLHWRPATAIHEAADDGNDATDPDGEWVQRAPNIGTSPEYTSGHSSFSAAGAGALAGFFCTDDIGFTLVTDSAPGRVARSYPSFSAAAAEAGVSRIYGGIHFPFSNEEGLAAGRAIAAEVLAGSLLPERGPTHAGACPL
jgi:membrane-associated phospholipid phosphatase